MHKEKLRFNKHQTDLWCKSKCDEWRVVPQNLVEARITPNYESGKWKMRLMACENECEI